NKKKVEQLYRTKYHRMDLVFNLSSFDLKRRKEELFQNNRQMKNIGELSNDIDSFKNVLAKTKAGFFRNVTRSFDFHKKELEPLKQKYQTPPDTTRKPPLHKEKFLSLNASFLGFLMQKPIFVPDILIAEPDSLSDLKWWYPANVPKQTTVFLGPLQYVENVEHDQLKKNVNSAEVLDQRFIALEEDYLGIAANKASKVRGKKNMLNPNEKDVLTLEIDGKLNFSNASIDTLTLDYIEFYVSEGLNKDRQIYSTALNKARNMKTSVGSIKLRMLKMKRDINAYTVEKFKKYAQALACILMFMIGAPLGAIIKKGGLGVPTIIAIFFFIIYYVFGSIGEKTAREGAMNPYFAVWLADLVLLPFGLFFMRQARIDARLFEVDLYNIWIEKLKLKFVRNSK
ncbi:MAG: LptF/LptG family permease, partial [Bacteroidota bacterium]